MKYTNVIITIKTLNICFRLSCVIQVNIVTIMLLKVSKSPPGAALNDIFPKEKVRNGRRYQKRPSSLFFLSFKV